MAMTVAPDTSAETEKLKKELDATSNAGTATPPTAQTNAPAPSPAVPSGNATTGNMPAADATATPAGTTLPGAEEAAPEAKAPYSGGYGNVDFSGTQNAQKINDMYDAMLRSQQAQMQANYDNNRADLEGNLADIDAAYQKQANAAAAQYEQNKRNLNQQIAANGLNTGAGSQAALAQNTAYLGSYATIKASQAQQTAETQREITKLTNNYTAAMEAAQADNDYKRIQALMAEYKEAYGNMVNEANILAQYGDFSAFEAIYGAEAAAQAYDTWKASNPDLAYRTGMISANEYKQMTGNYPKGYKAPGSGGGGYTPGTPNPPKETPSGNPDDKWMDYYVKAMLIKPDPKTAMEYANDKTGSNYTIDVINGKE